MLDADGKAIPDNHSSNFANNYTIRDRDISTVDIYILDHDSYNEALLHSEWYEENDYVAEGEEGKSSSKKKRCITKPYILRKRMSFSKTKEAAPTY